MHVYEVRPRKDHRSVDLVSDALPFGPAYLLTLSVAAVCVSNPDRSPFTIHTCHTAQAPPGIAEIVSDERLLAGHKPKASQSSAC
jgi:hypothetical protein